MMMLFLRPNVYGCLGSIGSEMKRFLLVENKKSEGDNVNVIPKIQAVSFKDL